MILKGVFRFEALVVSLSVILFVDVLAHQKGRGEGRYLYLKTLGVCFMFACDAGVSRKA